MHDTAAHSYMKGATPGCDKGWITDLQYIGKSGSASGSCHSSLIADGISMIQRLDVSGSEVTPNNAGEIGGYADAFASFVSKCKDIHVWIVGNEPNVTAGKSDPDCTSNRYADAYVAVHKKVHALPGHANDLVLASSNSPYSPGCLHSLRMIIRRIKAGGVTPDGFAIHAYTRAPNGGALTAALISDTRRQNDNTIDECPGGATWSDTWYSHFRIYRDYAALIVAEGLGGKPMFITESGNACDPKGGNKCYPDADIGYFQAMYREADRWNQDPANTVKIRAITPYRWTKNDDGTGRDFEIGARPKLLADLTAAYGKLYAWTQRRGCTPLPPGVDAGGSAADAGAAGDGGGTRGGDAATDGAAGPPSDAGFGFDLPGKAASGDVAKSGGGGNATGGCAVGGARQAGSTLVALALLALALLVARARS